MAKRKLTDEILELIEDLAFNGYSLDDIQEEADITRPLMEDAQVIEAIKEGRRRAVIRDAVKDDGDSAKDFVETSGMTIAEHKQIRDENLHIIELQLSKRKEKHKQNSRNRLYAAGVAGANIYLQTPEDDREHLSIQALSDDIADAAEALKKGDTTPLLEILIGNVKQLHLFNGIITQNLSKSTEMDKFSKMSNMQLKLMQEERKSIMAINEICNPKRTTFVKEISQHLHQNSEKKVTNENELQKQLEQSDEITDAVLFETKETENEKK